MYKYLSKPNTWSEVRPNAKDGKLISDQGLNVALKRILASQAAGVNLAKTTLSEDDFEKLKTTLL